MSRKNQSLIELAMGTDEAERVAVGLTYTLTFNLPLTGEIDYNIAPPDQAQWRAYLAAVPGNALRLLGSAHCHLYLPTRRALFFYAPWRDIGLNNLNLSAFVRHDPQTAVANSGSRRAIAGAPPRLPCTGRRPLGTRCGSTARYPARGGSICCCVCFSEHLNPRVRGQAHAANPLRR